MRDTRDPNLAGPGSTLAVQMIQVTRVNMVVEQVGAVSWLDEAEDRTPLSQILVVEEEGYMVFAGQPNPRAMRALAEVVFVVFEVGLVQEVIEADQAVLC